MNNSYSNLQTFNFGKRVYVVMKNNDRVVYFEFVNGSYSKSINSFNLYDNEGKSLTLVNQHFFMNELVNRINVACRKGFFVTDEEIISYLTNVKNSAEGDINLRQLFKGSLMDEINEANFESNKRQIISYLDSFKFDDFSYYDNVSVFSGSLDKNSAVQDDVSNVENDVSVSDFDFSSHQFDDADKAAFVNTDNASDVENIEFDDFMSDSVNNDINNAQVIDDYNQSFNNAQVVDNYNQNNLSYSENNVSVNNEQSDADVVSLDNSFVISKDNFSQLIDDFNTSVQDSTTTNVQDSNLVDNNVLDVNLNNNIQNVSNDNFSVGQLSDNQNSSVLEQQLSVTDNNSMSYIDQVKSRIQNTVPQESASRVQNPSLQESVSRVSGFDSELGTDNQIDREYGKERIENTIIQDSSMLPELDSIENVQESVSTENEVKKKKGNAGLIIFIIILILVLIGFGFYLYNFVF